MNFNIFLRSILSFGGHTAWAAIEGAAFAKTNKMNFEFIKAFGLCFLLHALWDTDTPVPYLKLAFLCVVAWKIIVNQISDFIASNASGNKKTVSPKEKELKEKNKTANNSASTVLLSSNSPQTKKFCKYCGKELLPNAKFCSKCGKSLFLENNN